MCDDPSAAACQWPRPVVPRMCAVILLGQAVPDELVSAVLGRHEVRFRYMRDARTSAPRVVRPHALFAPARQVSLSGVQVSGPTSDRRGGLPGWRTFSVPLIEDVEVLPGTFTPDQAFRPGSPRLRHLLADCLNGWA